jgi:hypothetical protein
MSALRIRGDLASVRVRAALASVHNLETLVKSPRASRGMITAVFPELYAGIAAMQAEFDGILAPTPEDAVQGRAASALAAFARALLDALDHALRISETQPLDAKARLALELATARVSPELAAAADLLELLERAHGAAPTDLPLAGLVEASLRLASVRSDDRVRVHVAPASFSAGAAARSTVAPGAILADAHLVGGLLACAVSAVSREPGRPPSDVTAIATLEGEHVAIALESARPEHAAFPSTDAPLLRRIPPTDAVVDEAARASGVSILRTAGSTTLVFKAG